MHVVLYRNLNLGHVGSPTRVQLEAALAQAGAARVRSFQTNGTVLLEAGDPERVVALAASELARTAGYDGAAFVTPLATLVDLVGLGVFEKYRSPDTYRETVTFFRGGEQPDRPSPWTNPTGDLDLLHVRDGVALALTRRRGSAMGNPTALFERTPGTVATTRTLGTIERLVKAAAAWTSPPASVRHVDEAAVVALEGDGDVAGRAVTVLDHE